MTESTNVFGSLGINPVNLFWQIVNFGLLMFVLTKVLYKPILHKLDERAKLIKDGLTAAQDNLKKQEEADQKRQQMLQETRKEVEKLIEKAKKDAVTVKEEILAEAKTDAGKLMERQAKEIEDKLASQEKALCRLKWLISRFRLPVKF